MDNISETFFSGHGAKKSGEKPATKSEYKLYRREEIYVISLTRTFYFTVPKLP